MTRTRPSLKKTRYDECEIGENCENSEHCMWCQSLFRPSAEYCWWKERAEMTATWRQRNVLKLSEGRGRTETRDFTSSSRRTSTTALHVLKKRTVVHVDFQVSSVVEAGREKESGASTGGTETRFVT